MKKLKNKSESKPKILWPIQNSIRDFLGVQLAGVGKNTNSSLHSNILFKFNLIPCPVFYVCTRTSIIVQLLYFQIIYFLKILMWIISVYMSKKKMQKLSIGTLMNNFCMSFLSYLVLIHLKLYEIQIELWGF